MMNQMPTIIVWHVARLDVVIITAWGETYGSLEVARLEQLRTDLVPVQTAFASNRGLVLVDLSGVSVLESAFSCELYREYSFTLVRMAG
jgi:hypothetical protein